MVCISFHESVKSLRNNPIRIEIRDIIVIVSIILKCSIFIIILLELMKEKIQFFKELYFFMANVLFPAVGYTVPWDVSLIDFLTVQIVVSPCM